eukprot:scaffold3670_cov124-Cylindrotheca_fusiformis.AAC.7
MNSDLSLVGKVASRRPPSSSSESSNKWVTTMDSVVEDSVEVVSSSIFSFPVALGTSDCRRLLPFLLILLKNVMIFMFFLLVENVNADRKNLVRIIQRVDHQKCWVRKRNLICTPHTQQCVSQQEETMTDEDVTSPAFGQILENQPIDDEEDRNMIRISSLQSEAVEIGTGMKQSAVLVFLLVSRFLVVSGLFSRRDRAFHLKVSNGGATTSASKVSPSAGLKSNRIAASSSEANDHTSIDDESEVTLNFEGKFQLSESLQASSEKLSKDRIWQFFQKPQNRNILLKGGGNPLEKIPASPELYDAWEMQSNVMHSRKPDRSTDEIVAIFTTVPLFPGLHIDAVSYTGVKLIRSPMTNLPMYEFTLIKEYYLPRGRRTMEWLFHHIAGSNNDEGDDERSQYHHGKDGQKYISSPGRTTHALTRVSLEHDPVGTGTLRILYNGQVRLSCVVPRKVLRFIPFSKHSLEAKVSKSIVKQLKREGVLSLQKYREAWTDWTW